MRIVVLKKRRAKIMDSNDKAAEISSFSHPWAAARYLPPDVLSKILSVLPPKYIVRCRSVCKQWLSLSYDPRFIREHQRARARARSLTGKTFLFSRISRCAKISLYEFEFGGGGGGGEEDKVEDCSFYLRYGDAATYQISNPVDGLMYATRHPEDQHGYLLNPFSREIVELPPPPVMGCNKSSRVGLGIDSSTGAYKLVRLFSKKNRLAPCGCQLLLLGPQHDWQYVGDAPCRLPQLRPVFADGTLYWLADSSRHVMAFNLTDHKFRLIPAPEAMLGDHYVALLECGGNLCFVKHPSHFHRFLTIWRLECPRSFIWTKQHDIDMSRVASQSFCPSITGIRGHEVLLEVLGAGKLATVYSYHLLTKCLHKLCSNAGSMNLGFITESLVSPRSLINNLSH